MAEVKRITALTNPIVKRLRSLGQKKYRDEDGVFLGEGLKLVTDALEAGWPVETLVYCDKIADEPAIMAASRRCVAAGGRLLAVSEPVLAKITRRDNPQMVVGVFAQRARELQNAADGTIWVALEGIKDPGNLGTIIRTSDAVGASGVVLVGTTCDPWSPEAVRATMGSLFHVPLYQASVEAFLAWADAAPAPLIGTHLAGAIDYRSLTPREPTILLMGNEQSGLPSEIADRCDHLVKIPQVGAADSLNLAVSTGVMLYELRRSFL